MNRRKPAQPAEQLHQRKQPVKSAWSTKQQSMRPQTHTINRYPTNRFHQLQFIPSMEDFPDTLQATDSKTTKIKTPTKPTHIPPIQSVSTPVKQTPQKKRLHSGDWRQIIRKPVNQPQSPPTRRPQAREHIEQPHPEPQPSTSGQSHTINLQAPLTRPMNKEPQMSVKDIVATSQLIMTMQQHLMAQMAEIQPNAYIHNIMKAIAQSMNDITAKYESCIGTLNA